MVALSLTASFMAIYTRVCVLEYASEKYLLKLNGRIFALFVRFYPFVSVSFPTFFHISFPLVSFFCSPVTSSCKQVAFKDWTRCQSMLSLANFINCKLNKFVFLFSLLSVSSDRLYRRSSIGQKANKHWQEENFLEYKFNYYITVTRS